MSHDDLVNYYRTNYIMQSVHGFSIQTLENMMPWERLVYSDIILQKMEQERQMARDMANAARDTQNLLRKVGKA